MNNRLWNASLFLSLVKPMPIMLLAAIFTIIGLFDLDVILAIGIALWVLYFTISLVLFLRSQYYLNYRTDDQEFNSLMDAITNDPEGFLKNRINEYNSKAELRGADLLSLTDNELFEAVSLQNFNIVSGVKDNELEVLSDARKVVFVLEAFDNEIQNGGLYQFFANRYNYPIADVSNFLDVIRAYEHKKLFDDFIISNSIDLADMSCFKAKNVKEYLKKCDKFDYDKFDNAYYDLSPLREIIVKYIRDNIAEF